jgi:hypothetical protein
VGNIVKSSLLFFVVLSVPRMAFAANETIQAPFLLEALTEYPVFSFYLGAPAQDGVAYVPNTDPKVGLRLFIDGIGIAATVPVGLSYDDDLRGKSEQASFIISPFRRSFGFDLYYQWYKGFYEVNPLTEIKPNKPARYPQLPDATAWNIGINSYFLLDSSNYSLAAAFVQTERQTASGGSWLVEPFFNENRIDLGGVFIPSTDPNLKQVQPDLHTASTKTFGSGFGYGHAWIVDRFYFTLLAAVGGGYQAIEVADIDGTQFSTACLALKANANGSIGYNFDNFVIGIKGLVDSLGTSVNSTEITSTTANIQFYFGGRF